MPSLCFSCFSVFILHKTAKPDSLRVFFCVWNEVQVKTCPVLPGWFILQVYPITLFCGKKIMQCCELFTVSARNKQGPRFQKVAFLHYFPVNWRPNASERHRFHLKTLPECKQSNSSALQFGSADGASLFRWEHVHQVHHPSYRLYQYSEIFWRYWWSQKKLKSVNPCVSVWSNLNTTQDYKTTAQHDMDFIYICLFVFTRMFMVL